WVMHFSFQLLKAPISCRFITTFIHNYRFFISSGM
ncbi:MAG: hypothetical protein ACI9LG_003091, partial [Moritella dasanensis]